MGKMSKDVVWGFRGAVCGGFCRRVHSERLLIQTNRRPCQGLPATSFSESAEVVARLKGIDSAGEVLPLEPRSSNVDSRGRVTIRSLSVESGHQAAGRTGSLSREDPSQTMTAPCCSIATEQIQKVGAVELAHYLRRITGLPCRYCRSTRSRHIGSSILDRVSWINCCFLTKPENADVT
jgi:hypothetical protein